MCPPPHFVTFLRRWLLWVLGLVPMRLLFYRWVKLGRIQGGWYDDSGQTHKLNENKIHLDTALDQHAGIRYLRWHSAIRVCICGPPPPPRGVARTGLEGGPKVAKCKWQVKGLLYINVPCYHVIARGEGPGQPPSPPKKPKPPHPQTSRSFYMSNITTYL